MPASPTGKFTATWVQQCSGEEKESIVNAARGLCGARDSQHGIPHLSHQFVFCEQHVLTCWRIAMSLAHFIAFMPVPDYLLASRWPASGPSQTLHFVCRLGEPVTLCWRLERSRADSAAHDSNTIQYDVHAAVSHARFSFAARYCALS